MNDKYISSSAIVVKYSDYSESSRILTLFSGEHGLIKAVAKGAKRKGSKNLPLTLPYAFCRFELVRGNGDLYTLAGGELIENFYGLSEDIDRYTAAGEITGELLKNLVQDSPEPEVLRLYLNTLFALCYTKTDTELVRSVFTLRLNYELGFIPGPEELLKKYLPEAGEVPGMAVRHILEGDGKKLYGFRASEDVARQLGDLADRIRSEER